MVRGALFPFDEDSSKVRKALAQLCGIGYLRIGKTPDGREAGQIINFTKHQRVDRPADSEIQQLVSFYDDSTMIHGLFDDDSLLDRKGKDRKGKDLAPPPAPRVQDEIFNALCLIEGSDPKQIGAQASRIGKCLKDIRTATPDVNAQEIRRRARNWPKQFPDATITADALAKWWARCDTGSLPNSEPVRLPDNLRENPNFQTGGAA